MGRLTALPILMYHSVAPRAALEPHAWLQWISVDVGLFEDTLRSWRRRGIRTVGVDDIVNFVNGRRSLPERSVALTFDDGYLDNWVAVAPLLERYGQRAIIFVTTDFIDPSARARPRLGDAGATLQWQGYLSVEEMRSMERSGVAEIQSHAATHTWEFTSPEVIDFYGPHASLEGALSPCRFLWLNRNRERKPFALQHLRAEAVPWGTPIYRHAPALVARRYEPDPELERVLVDRVARGGGREFFQQDGWRRTLGRLVEEHRARHGDRGRMESDEERRARVLGELRDSRRILEEALGHPVRFLAPPQGGSSEETLALARESGYELVTAASGGRVRLNRPGQGPGWVHRCGTGYNLFGRDASAGKALLSQRIVLDRCSGKAWATAVTKSLGALRRVTGRPR